jgi:RNA polymerase sigma-70 factor, ECF subfamily
MRVVGGGRSLLGRVVARATHDGSHRSHHRVLLSPPLASYRGNVQDALVDARVAGRIEGLYRRDGDRLWRSLLAYTGDREIASDAAAEAFAQLIRRGDAVREPQRWLWRSAFRIAAGELKERGRTALIDVETSYEMQEPALDLVVALRELSDKQRASVVLHDAAGYTSKEVAAIIGSTPAAVKVHVARGRRRLRQRLGDDG